MTLEPDILISNSVPKPLWGVAPRNCMPSGQWTKMRQKCYADAGYQCQACGVKKSEAVGGVLDCHEVYSINFQTGTMELKAVKAVCRRCHAYIHLLRSAGMVQNGSMPEEFYDAVLSHGEAILRAAGLPLRPEVPPEETWADWKAWKLLFKGREYPPKFISARHADAHYAMLNAKRRH